MTTDRDPQVGALLDLVEADPPRPGFWAELEDRLRSDPGQPVVLARVPAAPPRRRAVVALVAAAALIAVVIGGLALRDDGRERGQTGPVHPGPDTSAPQTHATTVEPDSAEGRALQTADEWIRRVADGDIDGGWELLGSQSRDQLGDEDAFAAVISDTAERYAPFADTPDRQELVLALGQDAWLVQLTVDSEADTVAPAALVVRTPEASEAAVEAFLPGPALDLIGVPSAGDQMVLPGAKIPLSIDTDAIRGTARIVLDGVEQPILAPEEAVATRVEVVPGGAVTGLALAGVPEGLHSLVVAVRFPGGTFAVDTRVFEIGSLQG